MIGPVLLVNALLVHLISTPDSTMVLQQVKTVLDGYKENLKFSMFTLLKLKSPSLTKLLVGESSLDVFMLLFSSS